MHREEQFLPHNYKSTLVQTSWFSSVNWIVSCSIHGSCYQDFSRVLLVTIDLRYSQVGKVDLAVYLTKGWLLWVSSRPTAGCRNFPWASFQLYRMWCFFWDRNKSSTQLDGILPQILDPVKSATCCLEGMKFHLTQEFDASFGRIELSLCHRY